MSNKIGNINIPKLLRKHQQLLDYQETIKPFTPTFREMEVIWGLNSKSAVAYVLQHLVSFDLVIVRQVGKVSHYYAYMPEYPNCDCGQYDKNELVSVMTHTDWCALKKWFFERMR